MADDLLDEEGPLDREIANELIAITPETWCSAVLEVSQSSEGSVSSYAHVIWNPDGRREIIEPSEELFDATRRLALLFDRYGHRWRRVRYRVTLEGSDEWRYVVDFEY